MRDRVAELESSVASLSSEVAALRVRVASLESGAPVREAEGPLPAIPEVHAVEVQGWLALLGRTLVILGGAYLLRAITSAQVVPYAAGVGAGLLYGAPWLLLAARAGARERRLDAFCYGASTALIGYPLVWEATVRFAVFTPAQSALLLGGLTAAAFVLSAVWRLHSLAAIVTCGALASAFGLGMATGHWLPYTTLAIAVGLATLWLGYARGWVLLRWPAAVIVDLMIVVLTGRPEDRFWPVLAVQLFAIAGYVGSFAFRTWWQERLVIPFEIAQSIGILALVLTSVFTLVAPRPGGTLTAAAAVFAVGIGSYVVSFRMAGRRAPLANLFFSSLLALVLVMAGSLIATPRAAPALIAVAGAAAAVAARRRAPAVLCTQATLFIAGAMIASGLLAEASAALSVPSARWTTFELSAWAALACGLAALAVAPRREGPAGVVIVASRLALSLIVVWAACGVLVHVLGSGLQRTDGLDAAWLATLRTGVTVAATLGVAYASRKSAWHEAGWLTYPLLVALGAKLILSDFPSGRPVTLFVALAVYGIALIAAPRALRQPGAEAKAGELATV
jgi:hypothetical protein